MHHDNCDRLNENHTSDLECYKSNFQQCEAISHAANIDSVDLYAYSYPLIIAKTTEEL